MPLLDKLREQYGGGPLCSELHIAPSTYYHCQQQRHHPDKRSARAQRDDWLKKEIQRVYDENHKVYGVKSGVSCYGKVSEWPDALWHVSTVMTVWRRRTITQQKERFVPSVSGKRITCSSAAIMEAIAELCCTD
ncbi:Transposase [Shigella boydii ATCC 9905]|nr:Transposase [Shigella boydii ATCC 9905]